VGVRGGGGLRRIHVREAWGAGPGGTVLAEVEGPDRRVERLLRLGRQSVTDLR